jgi:hypothetical protein
LHIHNHSERTYLCFSTILFASLLNKTASRLT